MSLTNFLNKAKSLLKGGPPRPGLVLVTVTNKHGKKQRIWKRPEDVESLEKRKGKMGRTWEKPPTTLPELKRALKEAGIGAMFHKETTTVDQYVKPGFGREGGHRRVPIEHSYVTIGGERFSITRTRGREARGDSGKIKKIYKQAIRKRDYQEREAVEKVKDQIDTALKPGATPERVEKIQGAINGDRTLGLTSKTTLLAHLDNSTPDVLVEAPSDEGPVIKANKEDSQFVQDLHDPDAFVIQNIPLDKIKAEAQVRKNFDRASIEFLANTIAQQGLHQPIVLRHDKNNPGNYLVVAGERRFRAHKYLQEKGLLPKGVIPAKVAEMTDRQKDLVQITENHCREENTPLELGDKFNEMAQKYEMSAADIAKEIGEQGAKMSARVIRDYMKLGNLAPDLRKLLEKGDRSLSKSAAVAISKLPTESEQLAAYATSLRHNMTVKQIEKHVGIMLAERGRSMFGEEGGYSQKQLEAKHQLEKEGKSPDKLTGEFNKFIEKHKSFVNKFLDEDGVRLSALGTQATGEFDKSMREMEHIQNELGRVMRMMKEHNAKESEGPALFANNLMAEIHDLLKARKRNPGEKWQQPSGRWVTKKSDGSIVPITLPGTKPGKRKEPGSAALAEMQKKYPLGKYFYKNQDIEIVGYKPESNSLKIKNEHGGFMTTTVTISTERFENAFGIYEHESKLPEAGKAGFEDEIIAQLRARGVEHVDTGKLDLDVGNSIVKSVDSEMKLRPFRLEVTENKNPDKDKVLAWCGKSGRAGNIIGLVVPSLNSFKNNFGLVREWTTDMREDLEYRLKRASGTLESLKEQLAQYRTMPDSEKAVKVTEKEVAEYEDIVASIHHRLQFGGVANVSYAHAESADEGIQMVMTHEIGHARHNNLPDGFHYRIRQLYKKAMEEDTFPTDYAKMNDHEFFAENYALWRHGKKDKANQDMIKFFEGEMTDYWKEGREQ